MPQPGRDIATLRAQNDTAALATAALAGTAAIVFIGAGIEALFTDWRGDSDASSGALRSDGAHDGDDNADGRDDAPDDDG